MEGGQSSWSSSISVHNEILKRAPELGPVLAAPIWFYDRKGEVPAGKKPYFLIPVFNYHAGYLSINFSDNYYFASQRHAEVPRLTEDQLRAIKCVRGGGGGGRGYPRSGCCVCRVWGLQSVC